ncbi:hypothetical protein EDB80DRAFT_678878 [Ilyonectria destructans]|nr:hypothetical protein EDB80DRAFT_678878 [Ilyonectria destructans]
MDQLLLDTISSNHERRELSFYDMVSFLSQMALSITLDGLRYSWRLPTTILPVPTPIKIPTASCSHPVLDQGLEADTRSCMHTSRFTTVPHAALSGGLVQKHLNWQYSTLRPSSQCAAAKLHAGMSAIKALQLLEGGRNVLSTSLDELRTDIISPEERRQEDAAREFDNLTAEIRETPDVESFLLPPSEAEMYAAAHRGPIVVINTSHLGCGALLVGQRCRLSGLVEKSLTGEIPTIRSPRHEGAKSLRLPSGVFF